MNFASFKLLVPVYILSFLSLLVISSINFRLFLNQLSWVFLGSFIIFFFCFFDLRGILRNRGFIISFYIFSLILLAIALFSPPIRGIRGWIPLGFFNFQPAELSKIAILLFYAYFFAKRHSHIALLKNIAVPFFIFLIPALLILKQPDLGSVLVLFGAWIGFLLLSGIKPKHLFIGIIILSSVFYSAWFYLFADYQKDRILGVFYPDRDPLGVNYNVIQSKIAIGSGGFLGKGFNQGTQVQLGFLPEAQTDFIFASLVEEWGLLGGLIAIGSIFFICLQIINISLHFSSNNFDRFLCLGSVIIFIIHFFINIGSALGISPVIGIPLSFLSYGGSNLLISFVMIAIINSIALRS